jgi:uncharacterized protein (DUF433 family)
MYNRFAKFGATFFRTSSVESSAHPTESLGWNLPRKGLRRPLWYSHGESRYARSGKLGGEPVFAGTRVPIKSLFEHLEAGDSFADFLEGFPGVAREQVLALLESRDQPVTQTGAGDLDPARSHDQLGKRG